MLTSLIRRSAGWIYAVNIAVLILASPCDFPVYGEVAATTPETNSNLDLVHFATRVQRFDELVFKLVPGDNRQARMLLKGLDVLSGEIADYRIQNRMMDDRAAVNITNRITKLRQDILRIESASPEEVAQETHKQIQNLKTVSWELGNLEDRIDRLASAAEKFEERTRLLSGRSLSSVTDEVAKHMSSISDGLLKVSEGNVIMSTLQEKLLSNPGLYTFDAKLVDKITADRRRLDDLQAILSQRRQEFSSVRDAIAELDQIDNEIQEYPAAYAKAVSEFRAHLILSSPEQFSTEMRHAHGKLLDAERMIEDGRRSEATKLLIEAREAYDRWAPTYQKAEELYLAARSEHDHVNIIGARRTALYAFLFQSLSGTLRDISSLEMAESRGIQNYLRAVEPLHDDFAFFVDRYQTVAETWAYVGGVGLKQRLQALLIDVPGVSSGRTRVVQK